MAEKRSRGSEVEQKKRILTAHLSDMVEISTLFLVF